MRIVVFSLYIALFWLFATKIVFAQEGSYPFSPEETAALDAIVEDHPSAVLVRQDRWSGSALLSGFGVNPATGDFGAIFKTNAHVTGDPRRDDTMDVIVRLPGGSDRAFTAKTIKYAYSRSGTTDWAFIHAAGLQPDSGLLPVAIWIGGIERGDAMQFTGFAGGKWYPAPNRTVDIVITGKAAANVPTWDTPTIGGQSGSGVRMRIDRAAIPYSQDWSFDPHWADGVTLTWLWNGKGAGQDNKSIWENIQNRSNAGPPRPAGLIEVQDQGQDNLDGYWECSIDQERAGAAAAAQELPVWYRPSEEPVDPDPTDPIDPPKGLTEEEFDAALRLKALGIDLEAMAAFQEAIHTKSPAPKVTPLPDPVPDPILQPPETASWTPPAKWSEGTVHNGKLALSTSWDGNDIFVWVDNIYPVTGQTYKGRILTKTGRSGLLASYSWLLPTQTY